MNRYAKLFDLESGFPYTLWVFYSRKDDTFLIYEDDYYWSEVWTEYTWISIWSPASTIGGNHNMTGFAEERDVIAVNISRQPMPNPKNHLLVDRTDYDVNFACKVEPQDMSQFLIPLPHEQRWSNAPFDISPSDQRSLNTLGLW